MPKSHALPAPTAMAVTNEITKPTAAELTVWKACCAVIGLQEPLDIHANVFDMGFSAIGLAQLVSQLDESGKGLITLDDIIADPVVAAIAAKLEETGATKTAVLQPEFHRPPLCNENVAVQGVVAGGAEAEGLIPRQSLSYNENLGVGVVGGCVETAALMPVLTWKFCLQEGRPLPSTIPGMYRGVAVLAGSVAPLTGMQMLCNSVLEDLATGGRRKTTDAEAVRCAFGAGALSASLYAPVEMCAIHQQKLGLSLPKTLMHLARTYGVTSLWRGLVPTAGREAIYTAGYLGLAPVFTARLMKQKGWEESFFTSAVIGSCAAGVLANLASHPVDTAKTVVQADVTGRVYKNMLQSLPLLYRESGWAALYRGGLPRTVRTCGAFFIVSTIREKCIQWKSA